MPDSNVTKAFITDNLTQFKDKVNLIGEEVGGLARLTTSRDSNLVFAINELDSDIGGRPHTTLTTTAKTLTGAINELNAGSISLSGLTADSSGKLGGFNSTTERSDVTNALNTLSADVKTLDSDVGSSRAKTTLTTTSKNIVGSINELDAELGDSAITVETGVTIRRALNALDSNHDSAISQIQTDIANSFRYTTISADTGSDTVDSANGSIAIVGDGIIQTTISGNRLLIDHTVVGATDVNNSGRTFVQDITMDSAGHVTAIGSAAVSNLDNNDIAAGAAINAEKIHDGTVSNTEFGYLNGVTSAIQTQIDGLGSDSAGLQTQINSLNTGKLGRANNVWITSAEGEDRFYFATNSTTYYKSGAEHHFRNASNVTRFSLDASGNGIFEGNVTAYGSASDERLKENIEVIPNALEKVKELKGINFNYKKNEKSPFSSFREGKRSTGLIAQDLQKVLPEAVYTTNDIETKEEYLAINYGLVIGLLVEAIKELESK
tara:strand:- start:625 stop:2103 length:1479 start_codon:yes stop_codon:yes gene_type:complete